MKSVDSVTSHLKELSLKQSLVGSASFVSSTPTHPVDVHYVQSSTNLNGNQQLGGNKKKGRSNNREGGKNKNKSKDDTNNDRSNNNVSEGKKEKWKMKFPCKFVKMITLPTYAPKSRKPQGSYHIYLLC